MLGISKNNEYETFGERQLEEKKLKRPQSAKSKITFQFHFLYPGTVEMEQNKGGAQRLALPPPAPLCALRRAKGVNRETPHPPEASRALIARLNWGNA